MRLRNFFPDKILRSFKIFLPGQLKLEGEWEVAISGITYSSMYQNVTEAKFMFFDNKLSDLSEFYYLEPGLYPFITDIVEAMTTLIPERHNPSESCITVEVSQRNQKAEIYLANGGSGLASFIMDLGHIFGSNVGNGFGVMLRKKGNHKPKFAYDIVLIHFLMIYTELIENNIVGYTKAPLLHCFPFFSKLKAARLYSYWTVHQLTDL